MRFVSCFLLIVIASANFLVAAEVPLPMAKPEEVGMSHARMERIGAALKDEIDKGLIPGAVVAVARKGKLVYYESFGYLDRTEGIPMPKDAIFTIASMTKPLATVGALMLYEENRLLLNDPVGKFLPELAEMRVATETGTEPARRQPTLQDLMRHTAGLTYGNRNGSELYKAYATIVPGSETSAEFLGRLKNLPLHYQPGTRWDYSLGLDVLGVVVESVTKQRLGDYLNQRLFTPLGMVDTAFVVPATKKNRFAQPLAKDPVNGQAQSFPDPTRVKGMDCGGACAYSTAADYIRFAELLRKKGVFEGKRILGRKTVEYMTANQLGPEVNIEQLRQYPNINGYGFGLSVAVRRETGVAGIMGTPGDFHWGGANGTFFWVDPREELSVVLMAAAPGAMRLQLRQVITTVVLQALDD
jgi:CubicO group peptidase (beta-lactamase class C family)